MTINVALVNPLIQFGDQSYTMLTEDSDGVLPPLRSGMHAADNLILEDLQALAVSIAQRNYEALAEE